MDGGHQGNSFLSTTGGTHIWTRHTKLMQLNSNENILYEKMPFQIKKESYWNSIFMEKNRVKHGNVIQIRYYNLNLS